MRVFKSKWVARFARREGLSDDSLAEAIDRLRRGIVDADLGGGLVKQRVAREGRGGSGGYRMLIAYKVDDRAVFLFGFAKNARENISDTELKSLRVVAADMIAAGQASLANLLEDKELEEIEYGKDKT
jgi:hypothetical protein